MIKVQNLTRTFGDFKAVDDISFEVAAGRTGGAGLWRRADDSGRLALL
jgi:ABC-type uncharacterized transport system ATPase subunit